jgi:hypothetical protein
VETHSEVDIALLGLYTELREIVRNEINGKRLLNPLTRIFQGLQNNLLFDLNL